MDSSTDLICLSYCSTASFASAPRGFGVDPEVTRILVHSRRNNKRRNVGGVLHFGNGYFFQYLEGPADVVDGLYARICRDERHHDVRRLTRRPIRTRRFEHWSMKFVAIERIVGDVLQRHGMAQFDPYRFTPALIDDLVVSCIHGDDDAPAARPEPQPRQRSSGPGLWNRLFGRR
ncbi:MAG: blue light sensor protein [Xanthomonadales bacterium]|nr:blue light sensor protein [Xanthomonadales bacterium]|tara:strand:+ start:1001 stop:1525 length:525 start_codon:yes stop_codon:yes gene_type:complete